MTTQRVKRPTKVKVLSIVYAVRWLNEDEWYTERYDMDSVGITERDKALINMRADSSANEDALRSILLHELLHTCTQASRTESFLGDVSDGEEFFIAQVSPILMSLLVDNPNTVAYLLNVGQPA